MKRIILTLAALACAIAAGFVVQRNLTNESPSDASTLTAITAEMPPEEPQGGETSAAMDAALAAVRSTGTIAKAGFITRTDLIRSIASTRFGPTLAKASAAQLSELAGELGDTNTPPSELLWTELPLTARVFSADGQRAVVDVWTVLIVGVPIVGAPRQVWRTITIALVWERNAWRIDGWDFTPGPTPALATMAEIADVAAITGVAGWGAVGVVGER